MFVAAIIIYVILAFILGPMWPLAMIAKGGLLERIIVAAWFSLLIAGLAH